MQLRAFSKLLRKPFIYCKAHYTLVVKYINTLVFEFHLYINIQTILSPLRFLVFRLLTT